MSQPPAGTGHVRLTIRPTALAWGVGRTRPWARVDDEPVTVAWGENLLVLDAGRRRVEVYQLLIAEHAAASVEVEVPAGQEVALWYQAPYHWRSAGRMGTQPQRPSDAWFIYLVLAVLVLGTVYTLVR